MKSLRWSKGTKVIDSYGEPGKVYRMYDDFNAAATFFQTMSPSAWLFVQNKPFTESELQEPWFGVELDKGGSILSCQSRLTLI